MTFDGWHVSFDALVQLAGSIIIVVGVYWRMRELIFKLHSENRERMTKLETKLNVLYEWWQNYMERRTPPSG